MSPSRKYARLASRYALLFGVLAIMIVALVVQAWRAASTVAYHEAARVRADEFVTLVAELETATQPVASRVMCAVTGGPALSSEEQAAATWPTVLNRMTAVGSQHAEVVEALGVMRREALAFDKTFVDPLRKACSDLQRLGAAEVQSRLRVAAPQRARVQDAIKRLRNLALEQRMLTIGHATDASTAAGRWLALLATASVLLAFSAPIAVRTFSLRLSDLDRHLQDESQERGMASEQLSTAQRRTRLMLEQVADAVVTFDASGNIQWVNPAAENLFGVERRVLHGCPVTQILPGVDERTRLVNSPEADASAVVDERGMSWTSHLFYLDGVRARADAIDERLALEVQLLQMRVDGQDIGVCVARRVGQPVGAPAAFDGAPPVLRVPAKGVDLCDNVRGLVESWRDMAARRRVHLSLVIDEASLWIRADESKVREVLTRVMLEALEESAPFGRQVTVSVLRVGHAARMVVADVGASGLAQRAAKALTSHQASDAALEPAPAVSAFAQARELAKAMGGAVGFRPATPEAGDAIWAQWPLADAAYEPDESVGA